MENITSDIISLLRLFETIEKEKKPKIDKKP